MILMNPDIVTLETLGGRVRRLRHEAALTTQGLAKLAGCNPSTIVFIEKGGNPTLGTVDAVADALGTTTSILLAGLRGKVPS